MSSFKECSVKYQQTVITVALTRDKCILGVNCEWRICVYEEINQIESST